MASASLWSIGCACPETPQIKLQRDEMPQQRKGIADGSRARLLSSNNRGFQVLDARAASAELASGREQRYAGAWRRAAARRTCAVAWTGQRDIEFDSHGSR
ncbi:hypothetical protein TgHK011_009388 [Trichoderma gracile]|nr:hypothetical protein TgHK011_009388 [Trichoderma gracile]